MVAAADTGAPAPREAAGGGGAETVAVTLITKTSTNPFFIAMQKGAEEAGKANNVTITTAAGKEDGDEATQIQAIEAAIARGDTGILITPATDGVNPAITQARDAGLYVIALDTPPNPPDTVDITFATDNFKAGELIGKWAAAQMNGQKANIAMLDLFNDKVATVDYNRDQGFLTGMGIDVADKTKNGDEAPDRQVHRRQGRRLHDRLQRADPGCPGRGQDGHGDLPGQVEGHQPRLHHQ